MGDWIVKIIESVYNFLWGDLIVLPLPGGGTLPLSLLVIILIPAGLYFTVRTRFLPVRLFPDMVKAVTGKKTKEKGSLSVMQSLIYCHTSGNGKPGGSGGSHFCRRSRSCVLDVGNSPHRIFDRIYRRNTGAAL